MSKAKKSNSEQHQFWQMAIETFNASGLSVRQFCRKEGLSEASFYAWRKKLAGSDNTANKFGKESTNNHTAKEAESTETCNRNSQSSKDFIQVSLPQSSSAFELILVSGNKLRINSSADSKTLTSILTALKQAGLC